MKKQIIEFLKNNIKVILTILIAFAELMIILKAKNFFNYWNVDFTFYKFEIVKELSLLFTETSQLIIDILFSIILYIIYEKADKPKFGIKTIHRYILFFLKYGLAFALVSSIFSIFNLILNFSMYQFIETAAVVSVKIIVYTFVVLLFQNIFKEIQKDVVSAKKNSKEGKVMVVFDIIGVIVVFIISLTNCVSDTILKKEFSLTEEHKVLLYNTVDYAIVSEYEIEGDSIIIYTSRKEKIPTDHLKTYNKTFKKVIKRDN